MESEDIKTKIVFLGDSSVGKSAILKRIKFNSFDTKSESTIGCEFCTKDITTLNKNVKLLLWDTAGQEVFRSFTQNFLRGAKIIIIVYSCASKTSFLNIESWIKETEKCRDKTVVIVGNKDDLPKDVTKDEINKLKEKHNSFYFFENVSAKNGKNIEELFEFIAELCITKKYNSTIKNVLDLKNTEKVSYCCI